MEPDGSLPCSQGPTTGPRSEPDESSTHPPYFSKIHSNIILPPPLPLRFSNQDIVCI
jgi:hypothetical protein